MLIIDSKCIADAMVCVCRKSFNIVEYVVVKTCYLIQRIPIACSLAPVRVISSVCQPVQGSRLDVNG